MNFKSALRMSAMALGTVAMISLASCGSDDDEPNGGNGSGTGTGDSVKPENVFANGLPKAVGSAQIKADAKGQVTEIKDGSETITFEYGSFTASRARSYSVLMKVREAYDPTDGSDIYIETNAEGFATYAYQVYIDPEDGTDEWWFGYNNDGQLNYLKRTDDGNTYNATYVGGDITKVEHLESNGDHREYTLAYTTDEQKTAIANKGCVMLFDAEFGIDMDEMGSAYFAGLLGKATKNLPLVNTEKSTEGGSTETWIYPLHWEFNANGFPTRFWEADNTYDAVTFNW